MLKNWSLDSVSPWYLISQRRKITSLMLTHKKKKNISVWQQTPSVSFWCLISQIRNITFQPWKHSPAANNSFQILENLYSIFLANVIFLYKILPKRCLVWISIKIRQICHFYRKTFLFECSWESSLRVHTVNKYACRKLDMKIHGKCTINTRIERS